MSERRYTEDELTAILGEAATRSVHQRDTYSLADMQRIASEVNIDPALVASAAVSLPVRAPTGPSVLGASATTQLTRRVNRCVTRSDMTAAITMARELTGELGTTDAIGDGVEWRYDSGYSGCVISIVPESDHTLVQIDAHANGRPFVLYGGALIATALTGFIASTTPTPTFNLAAAGLAIVPCVAAARFLCNRSQRAAQAKLMALADALAQRLG